ncbi:MAG: hypothetical protein IJI22_03520 [Bacilli bacterium]|nr:hypothetical protein [Bacilli bacterium]
MKKKKKGKNWRKALLRKKYVALLLALFTFGVNIFAWFAFSANAGLEIDGTVASWDVDFKDSNGVSSRNFVIDVSMKPGMDDFSKVITIYNHSDVTAVLNYEITNVTMFGNTVNLSGITDKINYLKTAYPFVIDISANKMRLNVNDVAEFTTAVSWDFDSVNPVYFKVLDVYQYDSSFEYYLLNNDTYSLVNVANDTAYNNLKNELYLAKDDADTYFGTQCGIYEKSTNLPCLVIEMNVSVEQEN